ncbi:ribosomal RNA methyltransferase FtsJ family protein [Babesia caballi]|uniref:rRNA methyltransferase 2, mitochondrial n=1 Tax=Babesia caballi TaxID=5871 RepID=A0AAV4LWT4_BABCB|nr:ribosomal RNA methyltransferase FtsJ family protein [Babesia caballi]
MRAFRVRNTATTHSAAWIRRQITDRYTLQAQVDNYRSRAAYKLQELDDRFLLFRKNQVVVELGSYPGGWSQVCLERTLAGASESRVIGVDRLHMDPMPNFTFIKGDINDETTHAHLLSALGGAKADVVLSDLAPSCTGVKQDDHLNSTELCMQAAALMERLIAVGGAFVVKIFMGGQLANYRTYLQSQFRAVHSAKPRACRSESKEMYFVCKGFIGPRDLRGDVQTRGSFYPKEGRLASSPRSTPTALNAGSASRPRDFDTAGLQTAPVVVVDQGENRALVDDRQLRIVVDLLRQQVQNHDLGLPGARHAADGPDGVAPLVSGLRDEELQLTPLAVARVLLRRLFQLRLDSALRVGLHVVGEDNHHGLVGESIHIHRHVLHPLLARLAEVAGVGQRVGRPVGLDVEAPVRRDDVPARVQQHHRRHHRHLEVLLQYQPRVRLLERHRQPVSVVVVELLLELGLVLVVGDVHHLEAAVGLLPDGAVELLQLLAELLARARPARAEVERHDLALEARLGHRLVVAVHQRVRDQLERAAHPPGEVVGLVRHEVQRTVVDDAAVGVEQHHARDPRDVVELAEVRYAVLIVERQRVPRHVLEVVHRVHLLLVDVDVDHLELAPARAHRLLDPREVAREVAVALLAQQLLHVVRVEVQRRH